MAWQNTRLTWAGLLPQLARAMNFKQLVGVLLSMQFVSTWQFAPSSGAPAAVPTFDAAALAARSDKRAAVAAMLADFSSQSLATFAETSPRHEGLLRAVGTPKDGDNNDALGMLVDATAGSGGDAALLAWHGWNVTMLEREESAHKALALALSASDVPTPIAKRLWLYQNPCDAREVLQSLRPEVVYLNPMSNRNGPSGAGQRVLEELRSASSPPLDLNEQRQILAAALSAASRRVVVKRPIHAPPLGDIQPSRIAPSNMPRKRCRARYDIYLPDVLRDRSEIVGEGLGEKDASDDLDVEKSKEMRMTSMMRRLRKLRIKRMRFQDSSDEEAKKPQPIKLARARKAPQARKQDTEKVGKKTSKVALDSNAKAGKSKKNIKPNGNAKKSLAAGIARLEAKEAASTGTAGTNAKDADENEESIAEAGIWSSGDAREDSAAALPGVGPKRLEALDAAGLGRVGALAKVADQEVESIAKANKLPAKSLRKWVAAARELVVIDR